MINYIYAYEIVALFLIGLVTFFYHYKNWLSLYRNRFFSDLLHILLGVVTIELVKRLGESGLIRLSNSVSVILTAFSFAGVIVASVLFWLYYLAQTLSLTFLKRKVAVIMFIPAVITMVAVFASIYNKKIFYVRNGIIYYKENSLRLFSVVIIFYVLSGIYALTKTRKKLGIKQYIFMQTWNIVIICFLGLYYLPKKKLMLIYYCVAAVIIIYYLIRHNVDMYIVSASGCFSMAGFKKVIEEKIKYNKSFYCISVCASSMQNMSNYCLEDEINQVHAILGELLRKFGGRHNVYHIHSYEYVIVVKNKKDVKRIYDELKYELPGTIRINDKNISMYYKFYIVGNVDSQYSLSDFLRIILSMKKIATEDSLDREVVLYDGEVKERIERELENIRLIRSMLENDECKLECMPVYDVSKKEVNGLEINPVIKTGDRRISIEEVWEMSREIGCSRDVNIMFLKNILKFTKREKLFEKGISHIRVNVAGFHIVSEAICEEFMSYIREYGINPENIILEVYIGVELPEDVLAKSIAYFRKYGVSVIWDHFGIKACNLKNLMEMPFSGVKISHQLVARYCSEKSMQLIYLIRMFKKKGWIVCLDGVGCQEDFKLVTKMNVDYVQGEKMIEFISEDSIEKFLSELAEGGILNDI